MFGVLWLFNIIETQRSSTKCHYFCMKKIIQSGYPRSQKCIKFQNCWNIVPRNIMLIANANWLTIILITELGSATKLRRFFFFSTMHTYDICRQTSLPYTELYKIGQYPAKWTILKWNFNLRRLSRYHLML